MDLRKLIEEINNLTEDEFVDEFDDGIVDSLETDDVTSGSVTDRLDAKTKISRALDVLKQAIEDFRESVVEEVDLIQDADLTSSLEQFDSLVTNMTDILDGKKQDTTTDINTEEVEDNNVDNELDTDIEEEPTEEVDFDTEAELDLLGTNNPED